MMYEIRAIFGNKDKALEIKSIFSNLKKISKSYIKILPEVEEYGHGIYCFYIHTDFVEVYDLVDQIVKACDGATFARAI